MPTKKEPLIIKELNKIRSKKGLKKLVTSDGELYFETTNKDYEKCAKITKRAVNKAEVAATKGDKVTEDYWQAYWDEIGVDNTTGIDVPLHLRGGEFHWNFEEKPMSLTDKITWVLTGVNVAILISLVIKNI